jgi:hypothetical protein
MIILEPARGATRRLGACPLHVGVGPAVSTVLATPPSIDTLAIPQMLHLSPIQLTAVPVKVNVAVPEPRDIQGPVGL